MERKQLKGSVRSSGALCRGADGCPLLTEGAAFAQGRGQEGEAKKKQTGADQTPLSLHVGGREREKAHSLRSFNHTSVQATGNTTTLLKISKTVAHTKSNWSLENHRPKPVG